MKDVNKGCRFNLDRPGRLIRFECWGLWDDAQLSSFRASFEMELAKLGPGPFDVLVDISAFPAQKPAIAQGVRELMAVAMSRGLTKAAHFLDQATTTLQIKRLAEEVGAPNFRFFRTEAEALAWLRG